MGQISVAFPTISFLRIKMLKYCFVSAGDTISICGLYLLGKATKHLPVRSIDEKNEVSTFRWTLDSNGYPTRFSEGDDTKRITW